MIVFNGVSSFAIALWFIGATFTLLTAEESPFEKTTTHSKSNAHLPIVLGCEIQCYIPYTQIAVVTDADRIDWLSLPAMPLDARGSRA